ncbi:MAG: hypothetical protein KAG28_06810 [Cocleimonas sp.]|nr:hypothetical protein [Cocleimonas sp.]
MPSIGNKISHNTVPHTVSQARTWVNELPLTNMGEVTKRLYKTLILLNQQPLPAQTRIDIGDVLLPFIKMSLDNLNRHFSNRSFPLLDRSQKVFDLKQALQLELAGLYQLSTLDMLTKGPLVPKKLLISIGRSIKYMSGTLINSYSIYNKNKANVWHDIHQLYLFACKYQVQSQPVPDKSDAHAMKFTIEEYYLFVNLIALSIPNTLRQGELGRLEKFYAQIISQVRILSNTDDITTKFSSVALLNSDEPAVLMPTSDVLSSPTSRIIDTTNIIKRLNRFVEDTVDHPLGLHDDFPMLNHGLAKRLVFVLTEPRSRIHTRFERDEKVGLVIRLKEVIDVVKFNEDEPSTTQQGEEDDVYAKLNYGETTSSPWVDLGVDNLGDENDVEIQTWKIENSSALGYGFCQLEKEPTFARIGELVAMKDPADDSHQWQILVIRWMDYYRGKKGLCFGAELLSSKAVAISVDAVENRKLTQPLPVEGISMPIIEGVREEANLILPAHMFMVDDILNLKFNLKEERIQITKIDDCVGVFALCRFKAIEQEITENEEDDVFDDVWDFI